MSTARRALVLLFTLALAAVAAACGGGVIEPSPSPSDTVVARVDGRPVTRSEVEAVRAEARLAGNVDDADEALEVAIGREVVRKEAERLGIVVEPAAVEARIAQVRERLGGEEALAAALVDARMSAEQLRSGAEHGLLRERLREAKFAHLQVSAAAVARFYRANREDLFTEPAAVRLGSIVLRTEHLARDVLLKLEQGEDFAALARMYSRDPESRENGGMLGWIITDTLPEPLARAVGGVHAGLVRAPVQGPVGWYILKVHERRPETATPLAEVADEVRAELNLRRRARAFDRWVARAVGRADVERLSE